MRAASAPIYPIANLAKNRAGKMAGRAKLRESARKVGQRGPSLASAESKPRLANYLRRPNDSSPPPSCQRTDRTTLRFTTRSQGPPWERTNARLPPRLRLVRLPIGTDF